MGSRAGKAKLLCCSYDYASGTMCKRPCCDLYNLWAMGTCGSSECITNVEKNMPSEAREYARLVKRATDGGVADNIVAEDFRDSLQLTVRYRISKEATAGVMKMRTLLLARVKRDLQEAEALVEEDRTKVAEAEAALAMKRARLTESAPRLPPPGSPELLS